ncbi:hypothetical protein AB0F03_21710 [Streptomyces sp. NPDC028722]|uniref:virginiamycin B lyase family protein n=1 Tax=Streptomyces sp. NPDC028722 TaxID=3155016 RepID=UPI0033D0D933
MQHSGGGEGPATAAGRVGRRPGGPGRRRGPARAGPQQGITTGPDRALWFAEQGAGRIGRMAADGTVTDFPTSGPDAGPAEITPGPDGAMWFTELVRVPVR